MLNNRSNHLPVVTSPLSTRTELVCPQPAASSSIDDPLSLRMGMTRAAQEGGRGITVCLDCSHTTLRTSPLGLLPLPGMGPYTSEETAILGRNLELPSFAATNDLIWWKVSATAGRADAGWFSWIGFEDATGATLRFTVLTPRLACDIDEIVLLWSSQSKVRGGGCMPVCGRTRCGGGGGGVVCDRGQGENGEGV